MFSTGVKMSPCFGVIILIVGGLLSTMIWIAASRGVPLRGNVERFGDHALQLADVERLEQVVVRGASGRLDRRVVHALEEAGKLPFRSGGNTDSGFKLAIGHGVVEYQGQDYQFTIIGDSVGIRVG